MNANSSDRSSQQTMQPQPAAGEQAGAVAYQGPKKFTAEEVADGNLGIRWVTAESVMGRPSSHDVMEYLKRNTGAMCNCERCRAFFPALAAPGAAIAAREQEGAESYESIWNALQRIDSAAAMLPTYSVRHEGGIEAFTQNIIDALTQPTTVQQAEVTDVQMEQIADAIWGAQKKRLPMSAAIEFARAVLALKGMQPGERKEET